MFRKCNQIAQLLLIVQLRNISRFGVEIMTRIHLLLRESLEHKP